ncbi:iron-sulfur cluster insertion protein ErpA [Candidatus Paracaedibacter symbiosus]|uniref:iron-sulfur cluster insertion protein ErpA n=1 Tax=Candidatus Paracaedibacter symbiosus TaxID=244582 RepID=UPI0005096918|nr:iron-sulfur cluster insertion protein ErpA [Candidatus Paracaedibacter symbiosus]
MTHQFAVTDNAAKRILALLSTEPNKDHLRLRISISGGGCSGFQYHFILDDQKQSDDLIFANNGAEVIVDETSLGLLEGSILDYVEDMVASTFVIKNPNAAASCGCGNSFAI